MTKEIIIGAILILGVAILIRLGVKILRQAKRQELINLINDMSYEISRPNFIETKYRLRLNLDFKKDNISLNQETINIYKERKSTNFTLDKYKYGNCTISVTTVEGEKWICFCGTYGSFHYEKRITMP